MKCTNCGSPNNLGLRPECCSNEYLCKYCWKQHRCEQLTDRNGKLVRVGSILRHIDDHRTYVVTEIIPTFTKGQFCVGEKILKHKTDGGRNTLRTRLMEVVIE